MNDILKDFIEVTSVYDGRKAVIQAESVTAVIDNGPEREDFGVKPSCRTVVYSGMTIDVVESMSEICQMIYNARI